jgi:hypothetical protein
MNVKWLDLNMLNRGTFVIKNFIIFSFLLFSFCLFAQNSKLNKLEITRNMVDNYLVEADKLIINGYDDGKVIPFTNYMIFSYTVKKWMQDPDFEVNTEIDKSWYVKLYKTFEYMAKIKRYLELAIRDKKQNTAEYKAETAKFLKAYNYFKQLQKNPTKIDPKKLKELKRLKREREKAERAKGQIN